MGGRFGAEERDMETLRERKKGREGGSSKFVRIHILDLFILFYFLLLYFLHPCLFFSSYLSTFFFSFSHSYVGSP